MTDLDDALDMAPLPDLPPSEPIEPEVIECDEVNEKSLDSEAEEDLADTRNSFKELIRSGTEAISELAEIASQSQEPRAYEVLSTLIRSIADTNKNLLDMHKMKKDLKSENKKVADTINNNLILTTNDLLKKLEGNG